MKNIYSALIFFFLVVLNQKIDAQVDSVRYHDGSMESQWGSSSNNDLFGCFVRATPTYYPAQLRGIRAWFRNGATGSTCRWKAYTDPAAAINGGVNLVYSSPNPFNNPSAGTSNTDYTAYIDLTSSNITITAGDVYVGATQTNGFFGMGIDNLPAVSTYNDRQWQYQFSSWSELVNNASSGQFGITAYFSALSTGIEESNFSADATVFPNPSADEIALTFNTISGTKMLDLFNTQGQLVKAELSANEGIHFTDISTLPKGIYFLKITNISNNRTATKKIIKI
jgi:hypothetical protein